ncbi:hypothetical protein C1H46_036866 [Malus baccata]|uniref:Uncharacterized protein n=1 Tax=Malus baccata TaxID=106549 RepID=A0A540KTP6_MALBA|nr:hypothetical protein C1H46_036866 [Malus baccata]
MNTGSLGGLAGVLWKGSEAGRDAAYLLGCSRQSLTQGRSTDLCESGTRVPGWACWDALERIGRRERLGLSDGVLQGNCAMNTARAVLDSGEIY